MKKNSPEVMTKEFKRVIKSKGWMMKDVAERWELTPRRMSQIAKKPSLVHWDAIYGLPENQKF